MYSEIKERGKTKRERERERNKKKERERQRERREEGGNEQGVGFDSHIFLSYA